MIQRAQLLHQIAALVGASMHVVDAKDGWPGLVEIVAAARTWPVALHVGRVGLSGRGRDDVERRYQNPASCDPVIAPTGTAPMLLGLWEEETVPVLVAHDAQLRLGREGTRVSLFVGLAALLAAAANGWAEHVSTSGERIFAFRPELFPLYAEMFAGNAFVDSAAMASVIESADVDPGIPASVERARRATSALVRSKIFRADVIAAYGRRCAMCGLGLGLVEGAHIHPVSATGSPDIVQNGLALCANHHKAFDCYRIWIDPTTREIRLHPDLANTAALTPIERDFVASTSRVLIEPANPQHRPANQMIAARNNHFAEPYSWANP